MLDPARLTQAAEAAARALLREGESANTRASYALAANGYKARLGVPALSTLVHRIAALSKAHQLAKETNPCGPCHVGQLGRVEERVVAPQGD